MSIWRRPTTTPTDRQQYGPATLHDGERCLRRAATRSAATTAVLRSRRDDLVWLSVPRRAVHGRHGQRQHGSRQQPVGIYVGGNVLAVGNTVYRQTSNGATGIQVQYGARGPAERGPRQLLRHQRLLRGRPGPRQPGLQQQPGGNQRRLLRRQVLQGNTVYSNGVGVQLSSTMATTNSATT